MLSPALETQPEQLVATRYESLIRLAESIRAQREPKELFRVLVKELSQVVQFDGIAQFDESANKVNWYLCEGCNRPSIPPSDVPKEEVLAWWVYEHQRAVVISDVQEETRFG
jgi:formate hydrogenlyase transcriptional activator